MTLTPSAGFPYYISLVGEANVLNLLESNENFQLLSRISEEKSQYRYQSGKWSIKQIVGHMTDHERIMSYRALRFSRKDQTALSGYDQELLVENARFDQIPFQDLLEDFQNVRRSTISFARMLSTEQLQLKGLAWKFEISVVDVLKATIGHEIHHLNILKERYL